MDIQNKKILFVCTTDNMITQFLTPHIDWLISQGCTVECACNETGAWFNELVERGYTMHKLPFQRSPFKLSNLKAYSQLKKLIKTNRYDIVHCHQPVGGVLGRLAGKKYGAKTVYVAHGFFFFSTASFKNKLLYKNIESWMARKTDALITMNEEDYQASLKMKAKKAHKVHGIGFNRTLGTTDIRAELGIADDKRIIVTVSELIPRKNYDKMLDAIRLIKSNAVYLICGTGKQTEQIKEYITKHNLESRVIMLGYRNDVYDIVNSCDLLFHFAHQEGLPIAVLEGMSCGKFVIGSKIRGNVDLLCAGQLLELDSKPADIASSIDSVLADLSFRKEIGWENMEKASRYSVSKVLDEFAEIYKEL